MEYGKIIAITGLPGLFELLSSKNDGAIVRSLEDKSTKFVSSRMHNFSHLESIEVFTVRDNVNLAGIFQAMEKDGSKAPDGKDPGILKKYFQKVYPDLDFERVYASDLKKMIKWLEILKENNIEIKIAEPEEEPQTEAAPVQKEVVTEEPEAKSKKAATKKKAAPKEEEEEPKAPSKASGKPKAPAAKDAKAATKAPSGAEASAKAPKKK